MIVIPYVQARGAWRIHARGFAVAIVAVSVATLLRGAIPSVFSVTPYLAFYPAVAAAALFGGLWPGLLATLGSALCVDLVFDNTPGCIDIHESVVLARMAVFSMGGVGVSIVAGMGRMARARERARAIRLEESERKYRIVADYTFAWEFWLGPDGRFVYSSPSCRQVTGYGAHDFLADPDLLRRIIHPEDVVLYERHLGRQVEQRTGPDAEFRIIHRDGSLRWINHACQPVHDSNGYFLGIRGSNRDITERKSVEAELVAARCSAETAKSAAEQASRAKDHFLAVLSHELRTPLTPVLGGVEWLISDPHLSHETRAELEVMRRNVELEARLIDDLLDLTGIARGKLRLTKRQVPFCEVLLATVEVCRPDVEARGLHLTVDLDQAKACIVEGDAIRLQQVFWNLLRNAIKFTPNGGQVTLGCTWHEGQVVTAVTDNGVGINREALGRIFNAFEQAETSITRQFGGLGLGLAISKALVEMHGGTIEAASEGEGQGATFRVQLPATSSAKHAATPGVTGAGLTRARHDQSHRVESSGPSRPIRVLLVEDHEDTLRIMTCLLSRRGYEVLAAPDTTTALRVADERQIDLLVSDLGLPDRSGLDLIRTLRSQGYTQPAIALSGYGQEEDICRSRAAGFNVHLTKPVEFEQFYKTISEVLA